MEKTHSKSHKSQHGKQAQVKISIWKEIPPSKNKSLDAPEVMDELVRTNIVLGKGAPTFENVDLDMFKVHTEVAIQGTAKDMTCLIERQQLDLKIGCTSNKEITTVGYMPIFLAPAHEINTPNTVIQRCLYIFQHLGQEHTAITVDQALSCRLMEIKWQTPK